jgi:hypothetical protein
MAAKKTVAVAVDNLVRLGAERLVLAAVRFRG